MSELSGISTISSSQKYLKSLKFHRDQDKIQRARRSSRRNRPILETTQNGLKRRPLPESSSDFDFTEDEIFREATGKSKSTLFDEHPTDEPRYDCLDSYKVSEEDYRLLLRTEIQRLTLVAKSMEPYLFDTSLLEGTNSETYKELSALTRKIIGDCSTAVLDNQVLAIETYASGRAVDACLSNFKSAYSTLVKEYFPKNEREDNQNHLPRPAQRCRQLYFHILEFATGSIARLLVRLVTSNRWNRQTLAVLAKITVKLKYISKSSKKYARQALDRADEVIASYEQEEREVQVVTLYLTDEASAVSTKSVRMTESDDSETFFALERLFLHDSLMGMLREALYSLCPPIDPLHDLKSFHHHVFLHETGFERSPMLLTAVRRNNISGATSSISSPEQVELCSQGLRLVKSNIDILCKPLMGPYQEGSCHVALDWEERASASARTPSKSARKIFVTDNLNTVISILVPLALTSVQAVSSVVNLLSNNALTVEMDVEKPVQPFETTAIQVRCSVQTVLDSISDEKMKHFDTIPMSKFGIIGRMKAGFKLDISQARTRTEFHSNAETPTNCRLQANGHAADISSQYEDDLEKMRDWKITAHSVEVHCRRFVVTTLCICAVIVLGALVAPFMIKNRLPGVDPFQITTFIWLLVGAILIAAKSRYVSEWPWHEFIHGRVECHSVRALANVTGIDAQMILFRLLSDEYNTTLITTGPYNGTFTRSADTGFSIDEPVHLSTLFASGFIILKVLSTSGEHLTFLDSRTNAGKIRFNNPDSHKYASGSLWCKNIPSNNDPSAPIKNVLKVERAYFSWYKTVGLYYADVNFG